MINAADAREELRSRLSNKRHARTHVPSIPRLVPNPRPGVDRRGRKRKDLGAGAFMKDETLRAMDGRVLRHGKSSGLQGRTTHKSTTKPKYPPRTWSFGETRPHISDGYRYTYRDASREESWGASSSKAMGCERGFENIVNSPRCCGYPRDGFDEGLWEAADEMFDLFINSDEFM